MYVLHGVFDTTRKDSVHTMGGCSALFSPQKPNRRPKFGSRTTALEVCQHADLKGKTALVTGGNAGIGKETVRALYAAGATIILCCRNVASGEQVAKDLTTGKNTIHVCQLDLSDLCSVDACIAHVKETFTCLDIVILNAGCVSKTLKKTAQGFEEIFGVNFVSQYYLTTHLLDMMKNPGCRIVGVSSTAHWMGKIVVDDLNFEERSYSGWQSYAQSKLCMLLYMKYLALKFERDSIDNIKVFSVHPGAISTQLVDNTTWARLGFALFGLFCKTPEQGAACTVFAATLCEEKNGSYLEDCHAGFMARQGRDLDMAEKLIQATDLEIRKRHCISRNNTMQPAQANNHDSNIQKSLPRRETISLHAEIL